MRYSPEYYFNKRLKDDFRKNKVKSVVSIPALNGNRAYEYRVIEIQKNSDTSKSIYIKL